MTGKRRVSSWGHLPACAAPSKADYGRTRPSRCESKSASHPVWPGDRP